MQQLSVLRHPGLVEERRRCRVSDRYDAPTPRMDVAQQEDALICDMNATRAL